MSQEYDLSARVASLARKVEAMEMRKLRETKSILTEEVCGICDIVGHPTNECPNHSIFK